MKNREVIMYQLSALSDEDFWRAMENVICPDCYQCPSSIYDVCNTNHEILCIDVYADWLGMEYDVDDGILIRNLEER